MGQGFKAQGVLFTQHALVLAGKNTGGGMRCDPHAITDHQNDVFGPLLVGSLAESFSGLLCLLLALSKPLL